MAAVTLARSRHYKLASTHISLSSILMCMCSWFCDVMCSQVYILSRMGNTRAALALIIEQLQDIPRAIEFVRAQRDDELVEELIDWALRSADTTGGWRHTIVCIFHMFHVVCTGGMESVLLFHTRDKQLPLHTGCAMLIRCILWLATQILLCR